MAPYAALFGISPALVSASGAQAETWCDQRVNATIQCGYAQRHAVAKTLNPDSMQRWTSGAIVRTPLLRAVFAQTFAQLQPQAAVAHAWGLFVAYWRLCAQESQ